jgi:hypothetical protein
VSAHPAQVKGRRHTGDAGAADDGPEPGHQLSASSR